ncbi:MAG TPA: hypothetical protein VLZ81_10150, partial [Blastocatellia bacterium]|nr:hypothetical protein [Blastocatellia bacterium]
MTPVRGLHIDSPVPRVSRSDAPVPDVDVCSVVGRQPKRARTDEGGWALLGVILAVSVMSIMLLGLAPRESLDVQRSKEEEMVFRGNQMAQAICRYYNAGRLGNIQLTVPPPYGYLYDLKKLSEGVQIGALELKFVRKSATQDPMVSKDWVPVRARDPRLMAALQAYAGYNLTTVPQSYLLLAAPPSKLQIVQTQGSGTNPNGTGALGQATPSPSPGGFTTLQGPNSQPRATPTPKSQGDDDDDDDDDDFKPGQPVDPLSHLLKDTEHGLPIVGVAPNLKGNAVHPLWGMSKYQDWVFIYIPLQPQMIGLPPTGGQPLQRGQGNGNGVQGQQPIQPVS